MLSQEPPPPLTHVFFGPRSIERRVIGAYLYPFRLYTNDGVLDAIFGSARAGPFEPCELTAVFQEVRVGSLTILVTRMGGLFVQPPARFSHDPILSEPEGTRELRRKLAFEERVAKAFTVFLCELSLRGSIVEPLSPVDIQVGQMVNRHALITSAGGGAGSLHLRALEPSTALIQHNLDIWPMVPDSEIADAVSLDRTRPLMSISDSLPGFVVGAYYWYARRQLAEALVDGWVVVEQVLDNWWQTYTKGLTGKGRLDRLGDTRTYSAAVRIEVLLTAGVISAPLAEALHEARKSRNDVAHRASVTPARAKQALQTMKAVIDDIGGQSVATPVLYEGVSW